MIVSSTSTLPYICGTLRDLVPFVHFKKLEKNPWGSDNFSITYNCVKFQKV